MSDDKDDKTEEPTAKRQQDALNKGQVAKSQEVMHLFAMVGIGLIVLALGGYIAKRIGNIAGPLVANAWQIEITGPGLIQLMIRISVDVLQVILIPAGLMLGLGILATRLQHEFVFSSDSMKPKLNKLSPIAGLKKKLSMQTLVEFGKSMLKLIVLTPLIYLALQGHMSGIADLLDTAPLAVFPFVQEAALIVFGVVMPILLVIAVVDFVYQKHKHHESLKMTKQEVKDEAKQTEGNPEVKNRIRQIRIERFRQRIAEAVPRSDVVITNPTHYAIALKYDAETSQAPILVAKGMDFLALQIRELAAEHDVPVMENPPLARAIYASVDLDQEIRPEHYEAVAKIISYVMGMKNGTRNPNDLPEIDGEFAN